MKLKLWILPQALMIVLLAAGSSQAIPIEPDDYSSGTNISSVFSGVTLTTVYQNNSTGSVYSYGSTHASTGSRVFAWGTATDGSGTWWGNGTWEILQAGFSSPVGSVSLDFIANDSADADAVLAAYSSSWVLLDSDMTTSVYSTGQVATLTVNSPNIAYVLALGDPSGDISSRSSVVSSGGGTDAWVLDNLNYSVAPIPEPATLLLLGSGMVGLAGLSRKRFKKR